MVGPTLEEVVTRHRKAIMAVEGVVGIGGGLSPGDKTRRCVLVYLDVQERPAALPRELDGYPVEVVSVKGGFHALE